MFNPNCFFQNYKNQVWLFRRKSAFPVQDLDYSFRPRGLFSLLLGVKYGRCLCVMDVTSPNCNAYCGNDATNNVYAGNQFPNLQWLTCSFSSRHRHRYSRTTKTGEATLEQAKTTGDEWDFIAKRGLLCI